MGPVQPFTDDLVSTQLLKDARLAAQVAHSLAGPGLVSALSYLELLSSNAELPDELRARAREAALRVAEAAVHLECLPDLINFQESVSLP